MVDNGYIGAMKMFIYPRSKGGKPTESPRQLWEGIWKTIAHRGSGEKWITDDETKLGINVGNIRLSLGPYKKDDGGGFRHHLIIAILHDGLDADVTADVFGELVKPLIAHQSDLHWANITIKEDKGEFSPLDLSE